MISFARFNGTHRILPIESWVENKDQPTEHLGLEILNWQILLFTEDYCGGLKSDSEDDILYPHLFCSLWWSSRVCEKNLPEKQYPAFLASLQHPQHQSCTPRRTLPWWDVHSVHQDPGKIIRYSNISKSFIKTPDDTISKRAYIVNFLLSVGNLKISHLRISASINWGYYAI